MTVVLGVQFSPHGTVHLLRAESGCSHHVGDRVLYPTEGGTAVATVAWTGEMTAAQSVPACAGRASASDLQQDADDRARRAEIEVVAKALIARHELPMKVLAVDQQRPADGTDLAVIYYTAPGRVDFRALLGDLGRVLGCRLDLRQVGDRDAARLTADVGVCGRVACCISCLCTLEPAADRRAPHASETGVCGRQMCCLRYTPDQEAEERVET